MTKSKQYTVNKIIKILSLGLKRYGAKIERRELKMTELQSSSSTKIDINSIQEIHYKTLDLGVQQGSHNVYEFRCASQKYRKPKSYYFPVSNISADAWRELLNDLAMLNPGIAVSDQVDEFMHQEYIEPYEWKFDFTYTSLKEAKEKRKNLEQQYTYLRTTDILFVFLVGLPLLFSIPTITGVLGHIHFEEYLGEEYPIYKNILLVVGALILVFPIINILAAYVSYYLGHKATIISTIVGCFLMGLGYFLE